MLTVDNPELNSSFEDNILDNRTSTPLKDNLDVTFTDLDHSKDDLEKISPVENDTKDTTVEEQKTGAEEPTNKTGTLEKKKSKGLLSFFKRSKESPKKEKQKKSAKKKKKSKPDSKVPVEEPTEEAIEEEKLISIEIGENEKGIDIGDTEMDRVLISKKSVITSNVTRTVTTSDGKTYTETSHSSDVFTDTPDVDGKIVITKPGETVKEKTIIKTTKEPELATTPVRKTSSSERVELFTTNEQPKSINISVDSKKEISTPSPNSTLSSTQLRVPTDSFDNAIALSERSSVDSGRASGPRTHGHFVVVAIDFGTTYSGYAFSFTRDPDAIHMMRKWEGGDPGVINQKTPTTLLLDPNGKFHSFGFSARDFFHDLDVQEAKKWMYFEKFKMTLHYSAVSKYMIYIYIHIHVNT